MNFLEMAQRVRQECGISGDGPAAVLGQSGISAKLVAWVQAAYEEIQGAHPWRFNWGLHSQGLTAGVGTYDPVADWGLDFRELAHNPCYVYRTADGAVAKHWLCQVPWEQMREMVQPGLQGVPLYCALRPDGLLQLHPEPQDGLTLVLEYAKNPALLEQNIDKPSLPERYHMAIVWRAVMFWCAHDENPALLASANSNYRLIMGRMYRSELPDLQLAETLA